MGGGDHDKRQGQPLAAAREPGPRLATVCASLAVALALYLAGEGWGLHRDTAHAPAAGPNAAATPRPPPPVQLAVAAPPDRASVKYLCQVLEDEIKTIDTQARQRNSTRAPDELAAQRKKAREEQFRIRC